MRRSICGPAALAFLGLVAPPPAALAGDCSAADPGIDDPRALVVEWVMGIDENEAPSLDVYVPDREGLTVEVRYRVAYNGVAEEWWADTVAPEPLDLVSREVAVPSVAAWDPEQAAVLSTLAAEVTLYSASTIVGVASAPPLRVAFPYGGDDPVFLDAEAVARLAPRGVLESADPGGALGTWENTETVSREDAR